MPRPHDPSTNHLGYPELPHDASVVGGRGSPRSSGTADPGADSLLLSLIPPGRRTVGQWFAGPPAAAARKCR